jgi:hypothetical protein
MNYCKNCTYNNDFHLRWGGIIEEEKCGKTVTVTAPETFYTRQQQQQLSIGLKENLNADGKCPHYIPLYGWRFVLFCLKVENVYLKSRLAIANVIIWILRRLTKRG